MKLQATLMLYTALLLLLPSCAALYKKSALYKEQDEKAGRLISDKRELKERVAELQGQLEEALRDTAQTMAPPLVEQPAGDTVRLVQADTAAADTGAVASPSFLDALLAREGQAAMRLSYRNATFDVLVVEDAMDIQLFWKQGNQVVGNLQRLKKLAERADKQLVFATNAGMYRPDRSPQGLYVENGEELIPLDTVKEAYGNFYMQPNGVFLIEKSGASRVVTTDEYDNYRERVLFATQSGPMAVVDGEINSHFNEPSTSIHIRSGVGVDPEGRTIFLISNQRVNLYTFGSIFKEAFRCRNALYLDGAISQMYLPVLERQQLGGDFGPLIGIMRSRSK